MSIRLRLTVYWAIITAAILLVAGQLIMASFSRELWGGLDKALLEEVDTAATAISQSPEQARAILEHLSAEPDLGPGHRVRMLAGDRVVFDFGARNTEPPEPSASSPRAQATAGHDPRYRWALAPLVFGGQSASLQDGVDAKPIAHAIDRLRRTLLVLLPLVFAMSVTGGYFLSAWALAPINSVAAALSTVGPHELQQRLPASSSDDEARRLVDAINQLLSRLEKASAAQQRFISEAAHELRTPLTVLRSGLEVTLRRPRSIEESRLAMEDALHEVEGLCSTAEDLLALARIEAADVSAHSRVDLSEIVTHASNQLRALADVRHQTLIVEAGTGLVIEGSASDLHRMLLNILDNAIKFTPDCGRIEVEAVLADESVRVSVRDNGPGLEPAELARIFDPFYRSSRTNGAGSGLGLALCREIVRVHGGEISLGNRPSGGCEVLVRFPSAHEVAYPLAAPSPH